MEYKKKPKYPLKTPRLLITDLNNLPAGMQKIATITEIDNSGAENTHNLFKNNNFLCWHRSYNFSGKWRFEQYDFPLRVLSWFPKALKGYRTPPAQGGMPAGAISSGDSDVDGEMLCIQGLFDGGCSLINRSRDEQPISDYCHNPAELMLPGKFISESGVLEVIEQLGDQYDSGQL